MSTAPTSPRRIGGAAQRALPPGKTAGQFYPVTPPLHQDNDLIQIQGGLL